jgi:hypothetical protein
MPRIAVLAAALLSWSTPSLAQHAGSASGTSALTPPAEAAQFDFLIGQWNLVARPAATTLATRIHGVPKLVGSWKAWRAFDGWGIEDELRLTDESGNPRTLSHSLRVADATTRTWKTTSLDAYRTSFSSSVAEWKGGEMHTSATGTDAEGRAFMNRSRYVDIKPSSFRFVNERSTDAGKTWTETLRIDAKRVAAAATR